MSKFNVNSSDGRLIRAILDDYISVGRAINHNAYIEIADRYGFDQSSVYQVYQSILENQLPT